MAAATSVVATNLLFGRAQLFRITSDHIIETCVQKPYGGWSDWGTFPAPFTPSQGPGCLAVIHLYSLTQLTYRPQIFAISNDSPSVIYTCWKTSDVNEDAGWSGWTKLNDRLDFIPVSIAGGDLPDGQIPIASPGYSVGALWAIADSGAIWGTRKTSNDSNTAGWTPWTTDWMK